MQKPLEILSSLRIIGQNSMKPFIKLGLVDSRVSGFVYLPVRYAAYGDLVLVQETLAALNFRCVRRRGGNGFRRRPGNQSCHLRPNA